MNEEAFNMSIRKFLKTVGVRSQTEIERAVAKAIADGKLKGNEAFRRENAAHHRHDRTQAHARWRNQAGVKDKGRAARVNIESLFRPIPPPARRITRRRAG